MNEKRLSNGDPRHRNETSGRFVTSTPVLRNTKVEEGSYFNQTSFLTLKIVDTIPLFKTNTIQQNSSAIANLVRNDLCPKVNIMFVSERRLEFSSKFMSQF